jgi:hypothetical protein
MEEGIQLCLMSDLLDELTCDTDQYLVIAEFRERLSLSE